MMLVAAIVLRSALLRTESRGAHRRIDYPQQDDAQWLRHIAFKLSADRQPVADTLPLH